MHSRKKRTSSGVNKSVGAIQRIHKQRYTTMKKTTKRYADAPSKSDVTCEEMIEAAVTQCATAKAIVADLKTLLKLRAAVRRKLWSSLRFEASQEFANAKSK